LLTTPPENLVGLALSGGGIRSATFCLGVLQGLHARGLLPIFDYLSTVSGGGFVGGWWSAFLARPKAAPDSIFPRNEGIEPENRLTSRDENTDRPRAAGRPDFVEGSWFAGRDPIHHLRLFANYLTPRKGVLSPDTWRAVSVISRNLLLTWAVLLPIVLALVLLGQAYFVFAGSFAMAYGPVKHLADVAPRLWLALEPIGALGGLVVLLSIVWLVMHRGDTMAGYALGVVAVGIATASAFSLWGTLGALLGDWRAWGFVATALVLIGYSFWTSDGDVTLATKRDVRRNQIIRVQATLLVIMVAVAGILGIAGFGHSLIEYGDAWVHGLGFGAALSAIVGVAATAYKMAPSGGVDGRQFTEQGIATRVAIAVTPPLVVVVLGALCAWAVSLMVKWAAPEGVAVPHKLDGLRFTIYVATITCFVFAMIDLWGVEGGPNPASVTLALTYTALWLPAGRGVPWIAGTAILVAAGVTGVEWYAKRRDRRSVWLLATAVVLLGGAHLSRGANMDLAIVMLGLLAVFVTWVVGLGWMADPNTISLHGFYKARLVRAYLGASNPRREQKEITESALGDDVLLCDLKNCDKGAPYHLVNTTLNLVGGHDLTTAQRSAASFVLSQRYCGSWRTRYRRTSGYMGGEMSLGAAVAISGAAASPNMGSVSPSAALAMLMSFMNIRLGYWAPTPNHSHWRAPQARMWPFYLLKESLSQTNDLTTYCYLTDGGHFDNTGLYSLVERGCRYIVVVDCGADPAAPPHFEDLGNAIRRCRIDFQAEIGGLDLDAFGGKVRRSHFMVGSIEYAEAHVKELGWSDTSLEARRGVIVVVKPDITGDESVDVTQYSREETAFPQQTTADQWFDEAQFESYRQLGERSAQAAFREWKVASLDDVPSLFDQLVETLQRAA
jgi:predicted acylesterase/phospholipase RssA